MSAYFNGLERHLRAMLMAAVSMIAMVIVLPAFAIPVSVNGSLPSYGYVNGSAVGYFDLNSYLPSGYQVTSAFVSANFNGDDYGVYEGWFNSGPEWTFSHNSGFDSYYTSEFTHVYSNAAETATLTIGSSSASASSSYFDTGPVFHLNHEISPVLKWDSSGYDHYTVHVNIEDYGYAGAFSIPYMEVDGTGLAQLNSGGTLGYSLGGIGDYYITGITLNANIEAIYVEPPPPPPPSGEVPEPATVALLALGLFGLRMARRRT